MITIQRGQWSRTGVQSGTQPGAQPAKLRRGGQTLVEFALIVPVLLAMVLGIIEFGWLIKNTLTIANSTRDGARAAALGQSTDKIKSRIENESSPVAVADSNITLVRYVSGSNTTTTLGNTTDANGNSVNDATSGQLIRVTTTVQHSQLTGFFPFLRGRAITSSVVMRRE